MLLRILELALTIIVLVITAKEIVLPLIADKPLFPSIRKTLASGEAQKTQKKGGR